jgi:hypothetical protein
VAVDLPVEQEVAVVEPLLQLAPVEQDLLLEEQADHPDDSESSEEADEESESEVSVDERVMYNTDMIFVETINEDPYQSGMFTRAWHRFRYGVTCMSYSVPSLFSEHISDSWDDAKLEFHERLGASYNISKIDVYYAEIDRDEGLAAMSPVVRYNDEDFVRRISPNMARIHPGLAKYVVVQDYVQTTHKRGGITGITWDDVEIVKVATDIPLAYSRDIVEQLTIPKLFTNPPSNEVFLQRLDQATAAIELTPAQAETARRALDIHGLNAVSETSLILGLQLQHSRERVSSVQHFLRNR